MGDCHPHKASLSAFWEKRSSRHDEIEQKTKTGMVFLNDRKIFGKSKLMTCTYQCRREPLEKEEQARKEQQRLDRIRRLKANGLQNRALFTYIFAKDSGTNPAMQ